MDLPRVILDCDTANEVDDQWAIAHLLGSGAADVLGVVSVHDTVAHGPGSRDLYQAEAERIVALCGGGVPCVPGAERPMAHVEDAVESPGLELIAESAREGPLTLVCVGPATDAAALALLHPELLERVRVVWTGGFGEPRSWATRKLYELNGRADLAAWRVLFEHPVDLLHVPGWEAPAQLVVDVASHAAELRGLERPIADALADLLEEWTAARAELLGTPHPTKILWDVACTAAVTDPEALQVVRRRLPGLDAACAPDWERPGREVDAVVALDAARVFAGVRAALLALPA